MTDIAYVNARQRRDEISKQINHLEDSLSYLRKEAGRVDEFLKQWEEFAALSPTHEHSENIYTGKDTSPVDNSDSGLSDKPKREGIANPPKELVARFARDLIEHTKAPVSRNSLLTALEKADLTIYGSDPKMVLSTMMWRLSKADGVFTRIPKRGYWLRELDYEPAGYRAHSVTNAEADQERLAARYDHPSSVEARETEIARQDEDQSTEAEDDVTVLG